MTRISPEPTLYNALILEPDSRQAAELLEELAVRGVRGTMVANDRQAMDRGGRMAWNLVFVSEDYLSAYPQSAVHLIRDIRTSYPELPIILIGHEDSSSRALSALREGYAEYVVKPVSRRKASDVLSRFAPGHAVVSLASVAGAGIRPVSIVGQSEPLRAVLEMARRAAPTSAPILIEGESGTGKELLAQMIHEQSRRRHGAFVKINCASLNESLLESELFGHEKGAFTGAMMCRKGRLEAADGGTLLLDEITETPPAFQAKLLRAIEQMCFERVGGNDPVRINIRILCTTNRSMSEVIRDGRFRADLYYRLSAVRLLVPPLRQRREDIVPLIWMFVNEFASEAGRTITGIERRTLDLFERYRWPGNIRQLRNMIRSAMILGEGPALSVEPIPWLHDEIREDMELTAGSIIEGDKTTLEEMERRMILETLDRSQGNQARAARILGISDRTLRDKVKRYRGPGAYEAAVQTVSEQRHG